MLGEGSFGKVFKGYNIRNKKDLVAVKLIDMAKLNDDPFLLKSLDTEIEIMKMLKSENNLKLYDVFHGKDITYLILELCEGGNLDDYIESKGGMLEEDESIRIMR